MKLSEQLRNDNDCGDFGKALEGYSERAEEMEKMLDMFIDSLYNTRSGMSKKTARAAVKYVHDNGIEV